MSFIGVLAWRNAYGYRANGWQLQSSAWRVIFQRRSRRVAEARTASITMARCARAATRAAAPSAQHQCVLRIAIESRAVVAMNRQRARAARAAGGRRNRQAWRWRLAAGAHSRGIARVAAWRQQRQRVLQHGVLAAYGGGVNGGAISAAWHQLAYRACDARATATAWRMRASRGCTVC
jgi:hypothetical protein